jgi:membrane fusion protein, multidrug efflux system
MGCASLRQGKIPEIQPFLTNRVLPNSHRNLSPRKSVQSMRTEQFTVGCEVTFQQPPWGLPAAALPCLTRLHIPAATEWREGMAQLKTIDFPEQGSGVGPSASPRAPQPKHNRWLWVLAAAVLLAGAWYYYRNARATSQAQDPGTAATAGKGRSGAGNFVVPVLVAPSLRGDLPVYFNGLGSVTAFNTVTIRSRVDGQLVRVAFKEGQFVKQGDLLAEIDPRPFQVQLEQAMGQLAKDQAQRRDAEVNLERFKLLFKEGVIPQQQLDTQAALVGQFDGSIASDQAQIDNAKLQLTYCRITAPISGRIGLRLVDVGNIVHATDTNGLLVITQLQPISVIFSLPQDQLPQVDAKLRAGVQLPVEAYDRDDTSKIATGKLATIDNQIDSTTGTYKLKSIFSNEDKVLFPNQFVNVHLLVDTRRNLTIIPTAAIQRGPQGTYVYAVANGNTAKIRTVTIAQITGNNAGLSAGVEPGEFVVIDGQDKLQDGSKINPTNAPAASNGASSRPGAQPSTNGDAKANGQVAGHAKGKSR